MYGHVTECPEPLAQNLDINPNYMTVHIIGQQTIANPVTVKLDIGQSGLIYEKRKTLFTGEYA
jgi:hypothetical protein